MTSNYFDKVRSVLESLGFNIMINKAENIKVQRPGDESFFVLYESEATFNKPLWRRFTSIKYNGRHIFYQCYPLHMVGRKNVKYYYDHPYEGEYYICKEGHDMKNYTFENIDKALEYFVEYLNKYYNKSVKF